MATYKTYIRYIVKKYINIYMATFFTTKRPQIKYSCGFAGFLSPEVQIKSDPGDPASVQQLAALLRNGGNGPSRFRRVRLGPDADRLCPPAT
jgi:hypothetical protein